MTQKELPDLKWAEWLQRWDRQQTVYLPVREQRFQAMLDVLAATLPESFVAIDLACGPGSISQRLLQRFASARCLAIDFDPVLLRLGKQALGDMRGRLRWIEADLRDASWADHLAGQQVDAVLSTTALHWLTVPSLVRLYQQLGEIVRPGGVFLNGDNYDFASHMPAFQMVATTVQERDINSALAQSGAEDWRTWWNALKQEPGMEPLFAERERRYNFKDHQEAHPAVELHMAALQEAGFRQVGTIWQHMNNRVVMALR